MSRLPLILASTVGAAATGMIVFLAMHEPKADEPEREPARPAVVVPEIPKTLPTPPKPAKVVVVEAAPKVEPAKPVPKPAPKAPPSVAFFSDKNKQKLDQILERHLNGATLGKFTGLKGTGKATGVRKDTGIGTGTGTARRRGGGSSDPTTPPSP